MVYYSNTNTGQSVNREHSTILVFRKHGTERSCKPIVIPEGHDEEEPVHDVLQQSSFCGSLCSNFGMDVFK